MIFLTVGSQKFQFNRLLKKIDDLIEIGIIQEEVIAQIGYSDYIPKNFKYKQFMDRDEFKYILDICDKVITHGGTGAIIGAVKKGKRVLAIPRLKEFGEHVDNHQLEIVSQFKELGFIETVDNIEDLEEALSYIDLIESKYYISNTNTIIESIDRFMNT